MITEQLGVYGNFGKSPRQEAVPDRHTNPAPPPYLSVSSIHAVAQRIDDGAVMCAYFVGDWAEISRPSIPDVEFTPAPLTYSDWTARHDTWAWAPRSVQALHPATLKWGRAGESADKSGREAVQTSGEIIVLKSQTIADLTDPRPLLRILKQAALSGTTIWIIHCPEWSAAGAFENLPEWLKAHGISVESERIDASCSGLKCTMSSERYAAHLRERGIDSSMLDVAKLLITTEDADVHPTGGIGTYIKNVRALNAHTGTLLCHLHAEQADMPARTVCPKLFVGHVTDESYFDGLGLVETLHSLLCLLPSLQSVEFQDYRSIGFRLVQAKRTGRLPSWLHLSVILHGSIDYVKFGIGDDSAVNYGIHELKYAVKDAYIFENVDQCVAPSKYLAQRLLSDEFGYRLNNLRYVRLPFDLAALPAKPNLDFANVRRLVYIGKYNRLKGWDDFLHAAETLAARGTLSSIVEIVSLAPTAPTREHRARLAKICSYRPLHLRHADLLAFLEEHRDDSLVVIPSRGENYPFVVLEQLLLGTRFVAYNAGGAPEVVDDDNFVQHFFCAPNAAALAEKLAAVISAPVIQYADMISASHAKALQRQVAINIGWAETTSWADCIESEFDPGWIAVEGRVALAIPVFNTPLEFVSELFDSLIQSKLKPSSVLLIDDGSATDYGAALNRLASSKLDGAFNWRIHTQVNKGLAGARNTALRMVDEPLIFFLDSDDCLLPHTLQDARVAMQVDSRRVAATGFAIYFRENKTRVAPESSLRKADFWMPLGTDKARALAIFENQFLTANAMVRTDAYRELGGWDELDRSMWEDWALYSRMAWQGHQFSLIPSAGYLYRTSAESMSKTYSKYGGRRRLVRNLPFASKLDANILYSLVNGAGSERSLLSGPALSEREAELIQFLRGLLNKPKLRKWVLKLYSLYSGLRRKV